MFLITGCSSAPRRLKDFTSDGCTLLPERSLITSKDWCDCCLKHGIGYWQGDTEKQRLSSNAQHWRYSRISQSAQIDDLGLHAPKGTAHCAA
ncbi:MAG: hypothetical protein P8R37_06305 [Opitutae bacterium]|nr:hypothetical protein [Opitutae bacterium]